MAISQAGLSREEFYFNKFDLIVKNILYNFIINVCQHPWCVVTDCRGSFKDLKCACDYIIYFQDGTSLLVAVRGLEIYPDKKDHYYLPIDVGQIFIRRIPDELPKLLNPVRCYGGFHHSFCKCGPDLFLQFWHENCEIDVCFIANIEPFKNPAVHKPDYQGGYLDRIFDNPDGTGAYVYNILDYPFVLQCNQNLIDRNIDKKKEKKRSKVIKPVYPQLIPI